MVRGIEQLEWLLQGCHLEGTQYLLIRELRYKLC